MSIWRKILLSLLGFVFVIVFPIAIIWFSTSAAIMNADTYTPLVPVILQNVMDQQVDDQKTSDVFQITPDTLKGFEPTLKGWINNVFSFIKGNTKELRFNLPSDDVLKPLMLKLAMVNLDKTVGGNSLPQQQLEKMLDSEYPTAKQEFQKELDKMSAELKLTLVDVKQGFEIAQQIGTLALILSLVIIGFVFLVCWNIRSAFNWIGSYFIIASLPLVAVGIAAKIGLPQLLASANMPSAILQPILSSISGVFTGLLVWSGVILVIGIVLLLVKYAFKKPEEVVATN